MNPRKRNLLEAFQSANREAQPVKPVEPAQAPVAPAQAAPPTRTTSRDDWNPGDELPPSKATLPAGMVWVTAIGLAFVMGVFVGRGTQPAQAQETEEGAALEDTEHGGRDAGLVSEPRSTPSRPAESFSSPAPPSTEAMPGAALRDRNNVYTLIVATYGATRDDFAWATYDYLKDLNLPVFPPVERDRDIVILVGASPTVAELRTYEERVRRLEDWEGRAGAFSTAYIERIDRLMKR